MKWSYFVGQSEGKAKVDSDWFWEPSGAFALFCLEWDSTVCGPLGRNLPTILRHVTNQFSEPSFPSAPLPSAAASPPSTALTGMGRLIQTSAASSAARGGPATKRSGRVA